MPRLRRNFPYHGKLDGLTAKLRKHHGPGDYIGTEIEVNQRFFFEGGHKWDSLREDLVAALEDVLENAPGEAPAVTPSLLQNS